MTRTNVVLADDHAILRESLRQVINAQPDLFVVGEAASGQAAVERVMESNPRMLCLDLSMPGCSGAVTIERVRAVSPRTRVLVLTMHDDPAYVRAAVAAGADGYVLKAISTSGLLAAVRGVAAGERVFDPALGLALEGPGDPAGPIQFSRREREVLELLARGHTHQEIADRLFVSIKTVETYRARLREKTGLKTRADLVRFATEAGLLPTQEARWPTGGSKCDF